VRRDLPGLLAAGFLLPIAAIVIWLAGRPIATDDLWWHLALGAAYAREGPWPLAEPMFHSVGDQKTLPQEWLFQVALHGWHALVGFPGLRALHAASVAGILAATFAFFRRAAPSLASAALATALFACLAWYRLFQLRPDLFSIPATFALTALLLSRDRAPGPRAIAAALGLLLVWANLHPLFSVGLALLLAGLLGAGLESLLRRLLPEGERAGFAPTTRALPLAVALGLGLLVTLANPRGLAQHSTFFVESASGDIWLLLDDFLHFDPLAPPRHNLAITPLAWLATDAVLVALAAVVTQGFVRLARERTAAALRDIDAVHLGLAAAGVVAMLVAARFLWLVAFPLLYLLRWQQRIGDRRPGLRRPAAWGAAALCAALALAFPRAIRLDAFAFEVAAERGGYWESPWLDERYCGAGTRFLRDAGLRGKLFHPFNLGGFLGYWLSPQLRTFIDGRLDHVPSEVLHDYLQIRRASHRGAPETMRKLLKKWDVDIFVGLNFPPERYADASWIAQLRRYRSWIPIFASEHCSIYLRRVAGSEENLLRVRAYYAERRLPFDPVRGIDASRLLRRRPAWSRRQGLLPADFEALEAVASDATAPGRAAALDRLGGLFWAIGAFADGERVDRELLALQPGHREARRRLADDLLLLGRPAEALVVAGPLYQDDPDYGDIHAIHQIASNLVERDAERTEPTNANGAEP
jgi:hypothetical protein